jgi:hypothetical protein
MHSYSLPCLKFKCPNSNSFLVFAKGDLFLSSTSFPLTPVQFHLVSSLVQMLVVQVELEFWLQDLLSNCIPREIDTSKLAA